MERNKDPLHTDMVKDIKQIAGQTFWMFAQGLAFAAGAYVFGAMVPASVQKLRLPTGRVP